MSAGVAVDGQMSMLEILFEEEDERSWQEYLARIRQNHIDDIKQRYGSKFVALFEELEEYFGYEEARERSKCFELNRFRDLDTEEIVELCGLFEADGYHICWDRKWAYLQGFAWDDAKRVVEWDYSSKQKHKFIGDN